MLVTKSQLLILAVIVGMGSIAHSSADSTTEPTTEAKAAAEATTSETGAAANSQSAEKEAQQSGAADALGNPERIAEGRDLWQKQCRHCHGRSAYPGKAPKLKPRKYKPEFVYHRVTNGFRKMPPWKAVFDDQQRWSIVAFVMSKEFSP